MTPSAHPSPSPLRGSRRSFFAWLTVALGGVAAALVALPLVGYLLGPLRRKPEEWVPLGPLSSFPPDETRLATFTSPLRLPWDGQAAHTGVYVRNVSKEGEKPAFLVLAMNCAHLGCPVSWFPGSGLFMCPCHGGVYYADGARASGPPPRGLFPCDWRVKDGNLEVQAPHFPTLGDTEERVAS